MNAEKKNVKRTITLDLDVSDDWILVTTHDTKSGSSYTLDFENESKNPNGWTFRQPRDIMLRIGMEAWEWIAMMLDELDTENNRKENT